MEPRVSMITLGVRDLARARRFYSEGLGLPLGPDVGDEVAFFALHGAWLAVWGREELAKDAKITDNGGGFAGISIAHNVASREQVDAVMAQAAAAGATITRPAEDAFWGGYTGYFADPEGYLWEIAWNPMMPELAQI